MSSLHGQTQRVATKCHSISQPRADAFIPVPALTIKGFHTSHICPTCLPVAHQTAINIQQLSVLSNRERIRRRPCECFQRGSSCEYLLAQVCDVMLLSHKCSCQCRFAHLKRLGNKQRSVVRKSSAAANSRWKNVDGGWARARRGAARCPLHSSFAQQFAFPLWQEGKSDPLSSPLYAPAAKRSFPSGNSGM